jgi:hypothetical protein
MFLCFKDYFIGHQLLYIGCYLLHPSKDNLYHTLLWKVIKLWSNNRNSQNTQNKNEANKLQSK